MHGQFYFLLVYVATAAFQRSGSQALNFLHFLAFALKFCDKGLLSVGGVFGRGGGGVYMSPCSLALILFFS